MQFSQWQPVWDWTCATGLALVLASAPDARHSRTIEKYSRVAATISPDYNDFASIKDVGALRRF
jgi:uncharacterized protein YhbP (UPF0306 family)